MQMFKRVETTSGARHIDQEARRNIDNIKPLVNCKINRKKEEEIRKRRKEEAVSEARKKEEEIRKRKKKECLS